MAFQLHGVHGRETVPSGVYLSFCSCCPHIGDIFFWHQWLRNRPDAEFPVYLSTNCVNSNRSSVALLLKGCSSLRDISQPSIAKKEMLDAHFFLLSCAFLYQMKWGLLLVLWLNIFPKVLRNKTHKSYNMI